METWQVAELARQRRRECGIGLCGRIDAIVRWLSQEHNIVTDGKMVEHWLKQGPKEDVRRDEREPPTGGTDDGN